VICPECGSDQVETTLHLVFRREGRILRLQPESEVETACSECGAAVTDETAEALLREQYPPLFGGDWRWTT
jgi:uncharacterized Zn finger protein